MKQFVLLIFALAILACNKNEKPIDVTGITPSPFIGYWEEASENDSIKNLSIRIGERNDSLLVAFYWESKRVSYITSEPFKDAKREIIPQACIAVPKSGNKAIGNIVNQYFSVYNLYPNNEYYELVFELKTLDTLTYKITGETNYWPDSATLVRRNNDNQHFSTETVEVYRENYLVADVDANAPNNFNITGTAPTIFIGKWGWEKNGVWNDFNISIGERNDSLLIACGGFFYGGRKIQPIEYDNKDRIIPNARLAIPKSGNTARGTFANSRMDSFYSIDTCDYAISLELKSYNTLIFKTEKPIGYWPDSAVMVRTGHKSEPFTEDLSHFYK
jgi:hypothetical protein